MPEAVCPACRATHPPGARFCPSCARPVGPGGPTHQEGQTLDGVVPPPQPLGPGSVIDGKYEVRQRLGAGGFGDVFRVHHKILQRDLALKTLHAALVQDERMCERFFREARVLIDLAHPNIVQLRDVGTWKGMLYLVMDFCPGETLATVLERHGRLPAAAVAALALPILRALEYAHGRGFIHRDLKPANLLLAPGFDPESPAEPDLKVLDFGIAKAISEPEAGPDKPNRLTGTGMVIGTLCYMSPEQAGGEQDRVGPRSDLYSVGALLYEAATGRLPFEAPTTTQMFRKIFLEPPPPFSAHGITCEWPGLEALVMSCLEKDPAARPASAQDLARALTDLRGHPAARPATEPSVATHSTRPSPAGASPTRSMARRYAVPAVAAAVLVMGGVALALAGRGPEDAVENRPPTVAATNAPTSTPPQNTAVAAAPGTAPASEKDPAEWRCIRASGPVASVAFDPPANLVAGASGRRVRIWDSGRGTAMPAPAAADADVTALVFCGGPNGARVFAADASGALYVWDLDVGEVAHFPGEGKPVSALHADPNEKVIAAGDAGGTVRLWDLVSTNKLTCSIRLPAAVSALAFGPGGRTLAVAWEGGAIRRWTMPSEKETDGIPEVAATATCMTFRAGGKSVVAGDAQGKIRVYDFTTGKPVAEMDAGPAAIRSLALGEGDTPLVTGSEDGLIRVWDLSSGKERARLRGHTQAVGSLALTRDGRWLVSGSQDGTIRIWELP